MSDSLPSDSTLEEALRHVIRETFKRGDTDNITVKRMRTATEERLRLQHDFFKNDDMWKARSKEVIEEEASAQHEASQDDGRVEPVTNSSSPETIKSSPVKPSAKEKRPIAPEASKIRKKRKTEADIDEAPTSNKAKSIVKGQGSEKKSHSTKSKIAVDSGGEELSEIKAPSISASPAALVQVESLQLDDESELSDLIDDLPKPKSKRSRMDPKGISGKAKSKHEKKNKVVKVVKNKSLEDPDTEKIKSLQGWLLKCGIRKVWGTYLKPYETPKAKIRHLESMLSDVGMTGRFSLEKASQIKEKRELAADLEAVQEGDKKWGKADSEEDGGRPKRRLAKGFQGLDFLDDDDGEETD